MILLDRQTDRQTDRQKDGRIGRKSKYFFIFYIAIALIASLVVFLTNYLHKTPDFLYREEITNGIDATSNPIRISDLQCVNGIYEISVQYTTDGYGMIVVEGENSDSIWSVRSASTLLPPYTDHIVTRIYVNGSAGCSISISDVGSDSGLKIYSVYIVYRHRLSAIYEALKTLLLMLVLGGLFVFLVKIRNNSVHLDKIGICGVILVTFISSIGFMMSYIPGGQDVEFHLGRIAAIADGLMSGQFPVRMYSFFANDYGYPLGIMYGDIFLYPVALLHILGFPLYNTYVIYVMSINFLTAVISYKSFKYISNDSIISIIGCGVYTLSLWRLNDVYIRAAVGEYTAIAFLPLIALGVYIAANSNADLEKRKRVTAYLVIGYTCIIQSHMLTAVMCAFFLLITMFLCGYKIIRNGYLKSIIVSIFSIILINLGFIIPFIDYYFSHDFSVKNQNLMIQGQGAYPSQIFSVLGNFNNGSITINENIGISDEMPLGIGITMLIILFASFSGSLFFENRHIRKQCAVLFAMSVLSIWMSTCYFPYDKLFVYLSWLSAILNSVQFPWRYLTIAICLLALALVIILNELKKNTMYYNICTGIIVLTICSSISFISGRISENDYNIYPMSEAQIVSPLINNDTLYFLNDMDLNEIRNRDIYTYEDNILVQAEKNSGAFGYELFVNNMEDHDSYVDIPLTNYKGYKAEDMLGNDFELSDGDNLRIRITIPEHYCGEITVKFREPWYWRIGEVISVLALLFFIYSIFVDSKNVSPIKRLGAYIFVFQRNRERARDYV